MRAWKRYAALAFAFSCAAGPAVAEQATPEQCETLVNLHLVSLGTPDENDAMKLFELFLDRSQGVSCDAKYQIPLRRVSPPQRFNIFYNPQSSQAMILKRDGEVISTFKLGTLEIQALKTDEALAIQKPFGGRSPLGAQPALDRLQSGVPG